MSRPARTPSMTIMMKIAFGVSLAIGVESERGTVLRRTSFSGGMTSMSSPMFGTGPVRQAQDRLHPSLHVPVSSDCLVCGVQYFGGDEDREVHPENAGGASGLSVARVRSQSFRDR